MYSIKFQCYIFFSKTEIESYHAQGIKNISKLQENKRSRSLLTNALSVTARIRTQCLCIFVITISLCNIPLSEWKRETTKLLASFITSCTKNDTWNQMGFLLLCHFPLPIRLYRQPFLSLLARKQFFHFLFYALIEPYCCESVLE